MHPTFFAEYDTSYPSRFDVLDRMCVICPGGKGNSCPSACLPASSSHSARCTAHSHLSLLAGWEEEATNLWMNWCGCARQEGAGDRAFPFRLALEPQPSTLISTSLHLLPATATATTAACKPLMQKQKKDKCTGYGVLCKGKCIRLRYRGDLGT